ERLPGEHRRHPQRTPQRPRHDAPPGARQRSAHGRRRRPRHLALDGRCVRGEGMSHPMVSDATLHQLSLSREEYALICARRGRERNALELGMFGALWSEHCGYKNSRPLLRLLPTRGEHVLTKAGEENAGAVDIGDGWLVAMKVESHNHPSAIEPYEGAATGVG